MSSATPVSVQCHYDVLGVEQAADVTTIKKAHRKLALKFHPDKTGNDPSAAEQFRLVQQAYETLSDPSERKWYDDHRDAILNGWSASGGMGDSTDMLFDVVPFTYTGCFRGYGDDEGGYYAVYRSVFRKIYEGEESGTRASEDKNNNDSSLDYLSTDFGSSTSDWSDVAAFYQGWESFSSGLNFAWTDMFDIKEAPNRRVRRAMEDENKKARRTAKRERNDDVLALVRFVKKRDPRVQAKQEELQAEKIRKAQLMEQEIEERKRRAQQAREEWKLQAEKSMAEQEEEDRLAGRVRLADLEEDDYDYGGGKKKKGKRKKGKNKKNNYQEEEDDEDNDNNGDFEVSPSDKNAPQGDGTKINEEERGGTPETDTETTKTEGDVAQKLAQPIDPLEQDDKEEELLLSEEEDDDDEPEPDVWRCDCCRKDFKSPAQMDNHMKSKKHKEAFKKYQKKLEEMEKEKIMQEFLVS